MKKYLIILLFPILLIGGQNISVFDSVMKIKWHNKFDSKKVRVNGIKYKYLSLEIDTKLDFTDAMVERSNPKNDILTHLWNIIVYHNQHDLESIRPLAAKDDLFQSMELESLKSIWRLKEYEYWHFTHYILYEDYLIIRGVKKSISGNRIIDLWAFSYESGSWKLNIHSERYSKINDFQDVLFNTVTP